MNDPTMKLLLPRPAHVIHELPPKYRWEFTRRHPYYVQLADMFWSFPARLADDPRLEPLMQRVRGLLVLLGVTADPPRPETSFDELAKSPDLSRSWIDGAIYPLTMRGLVMPLLTLPEQTKNAIVHALVQSMTTDGGVYRAMVELAQCDDIALSSHPGSTVIGVNMHMPTSAILDAVETLVKETKSSQAISETRRRFDALDDKLSAWDLREGWTGAGYDPEHESSFDEAATRLNVSASTAAKRYYDAFYFITGFEYSFENWFIAFHGQKLLGLDGLSSLRRRNVRSRAHHSESDSNQKQPGDSLQTESIDFRLCDVGPEAFEVLEDIRELIRQHFNDDAIAERLGVRAAVVRCLRRRLVPESGHST